MKKPVQSYGPFNEEFVMCIGRNAEINLQIDEEIVSYKMADYILWGYLFHRIEINCIPTDKIYFS